MSKRNSSELNGFTRRRRRCSEQADPPAYTSNKAYSCVYSSRDNVIKVTLPFQEVPIVFDHNSMLKNIMHEPGSAELKTCRQGDYKVDFVLYLYSENSSICSFILEADGKAMSGGVFTSTLSGGYQICSGSTMARLGYRDDIRLLFTAPSAMQITLANATLSAVKMN